MFYKENTMPNKKSIREVHGLTKKYIQNLSQYRAFFGKLNDIQMAQDKLAKKILKMKNIQSIVSILEESSQIENDTILNYSLLKKNSDYFSLWFVKVLFAILTLPISVPILLLWSQITHEGRTISKISFN